MESSVLSALYGDYAIGVGIAALGGGIGIGLLFFAGLTAAGRQPAMYSKILTTMIIGTAFIEALTIYTLITPFLVK